MPDTNISVLIVDDSFLMRRILRNILEKQPEFSVAAEAANGLEALELLSTIQPDLILLDIEMPKMDGIEFLRLASMLTDAKVIIVSSVANLNSKEAQEALTLGAVDIIHKPSGVLSLDMETEKSGELITAIKNAMATTPSYG